MKLLQNRTFCCTTGLAIILAIQGVQSATASPPITMTPLKGFGGPDGWLTPGENAYQFLGTTNLERGLAYGNNHLYLVSRYGGINIRILDKFTGADLGALPADTNIVQGGAFPVNLVGVGGDGVIYVCNLANPVNPSPLKVYRWANETSAPTVAFSTTNITGRRVGDSFDVIGSGSSTLLLVGESTWTGVGSGSSYAVMSTTNGFDFAGNLIAFSPALSTTKDLNPGITFTDFEHVLRAQAGSILYTRFSGTNGTLIATSSLSGSQRVMNYTLVGGTPLLATLDTGTSIVRIYDATDPDHLVLLLTSSRTLSNPNGNGTGSLAWGDVLDYGDGTYTTFLYALNSNNGIQAFAVGVGGVCNLPSGVAPYITIQPTNQSLAYGQAASISVAGFGAKPTSYQWTKNGINLIESSRVSGVRGPTLTLSNVFCGDTGGYSVIVSNPLQAITSQVARLTVADPFIQTQPSSQTRHWQDSVTFSVVAMGSPPLNYQWSKNSLPLAGANLPSLTLTNLQFGDEGSFQVLISGSCGNVTSTVATLTMDRNMVDQNFNPNVDGLVYTLVPQSDGKILIGGQFTSIGGQPCTNIGRIFPDGRLDASFVSRSNSMAYAMALQKDGKILVGGRVSSSSPAEMKRGLWRLNGDGSLDSTFNLSATGPSLPEIRTLVRQSDGKILVGGRFSALGGISRTNLARLNDDGSLDSSFNPRVNRLVNTANPAVQTIAVQPDGRILVGGDFTDVGGVVRTNLARLDLGGALDLSFAPHPDREVTCLAVLTNGQIMVGGLFRTNAGVASYRLTRLNGDGTKDPSFNLEPLGGTEYTIVVQADGRILIGGAFQYLGGVRGTFARIFPDGRIDDSIMAYQPAMGSGSVWSAVVQPDGKLLLGGFFQTWGGYGRGGIVRLNTTEPSQDTLYTQGSLVHWLRAGDSHEILFADLDSSPDGVEWNRVASGTRIPQGWEFGGLPVTSNTWLRIRGGVSGGYGNGSSWFVESIYGPALVVSSPASRTNNAGTVATFSAHVGGTAPLSCRWLKNGAPLMEGGNLLGAHTSTLTLSNVLGADAGVYSLIVTNVFGSVTSQVATLTVIDPRIASQPLSQSVDAGDRLELTAAVIGTEPLGFQWFKAGVALDDAENVSGSHARTLTLNDTTVGAAGGYWVVASNAFGSVTSEVAQVTVNLVSVDGEFNPGANQLVRALAEQPDGKVLVGGSFTNLGGQVRRYIGRLNADGDVDTTFNPGANGPVNCLAVQTDGKILVGGSFTNLGGQVRRYIGRLNSDGTLDSMFDPGLGISGTNSSISCLAVQSDGKILLGGMFTNLGGQARRYIGRLNADGSVDATFDPGASSTVLSLAQQSDGKILVGGNFTTFGGQARSRIARLNADGSLDLSFNPGASSLVYSLAPQSDGKILVAGAFTTLGGQARRYIGRLTEDGSLESTFDPGANNTVYSLAVQSDGKILVGGTFTNLAGQARSRIGRLNADGSLDTTFNPGANSTVYSLALQADGKILLGGSFMNVGGLARTNIARLNATEPATQSLALEVSTILWLRGGTSPEVWRTTCDYSTNQADWITCGVASRVPGGWQWTNAVSPVGASVRLRGFVTGGQYGASSWFVETNLLTVSPALVAQPVSQTNDIGADVEFAATAEGTPNLYYQWCKDGIALTAATNISVALANIQESDQGLYTVIVANAFGAVTSAPAMLMVNQPPVADASATRPLLISPNDVDAVAVLDGSRSTDPDGDPLCFAWLEANTTLASGVAAVIDLPVGLHELALVASDGRLTTTNTVSVEIITIAQAAERLAIGVVGDVSRFQPLIATLRAALASIDRKNPNSAINQLQAFQNQMRTQIAPLDAALADSFIQQSQRIIDALSSGTDGGHPHARFTGVKHQPNGHVQLCFAAGHGTIHVVEASADLNQWEMIGVAEEQAEGSFTFEDAQAAQFPSRFYRIVAR